METITEFHFLRPYLLLLLLPFACLLWWLKQQPLKSNWQAVCDPELLQYLTLNTVKVTSYYFGLLSFAAMLAIIAMAGPTWQQLPQPVFKQQSALVIALDLSLSMQATDIKPSRLQQAKYKLLDLLEQRTEGETALLVYAAWPFVVTPLTDDTKTIASQVPVLDSGLMPQQGSRTDRVINKALDLLQQSAYPQGDILLITDGVSTTDLDTRLLRRLQQSQVHLSILGVGTTEGGPINLKQGGFLKDEQGGIVISKLPVSKLQALAQQFQGRYHSISVDDNDIQYLLAGFTSTDENLELSDLKSDQWREFGPWLLLLILPIIALTFRKGFVLLVLVVILVPKPSWAWHWDSLWQNQNQQAQHALEQQKFKQAAQLFTDPAWQATALYKAGDYQQAAEQFGQLNTADGFYNQGNALAKLQQFEQAIQAYQKALEKNPQHQDAKDNLKVIEDSLKRQEQQQQQPSQSQQDSAEQEQEKSASQQSQQDSAEQEQEKSASQQSQQDSAEQEQEKSASQQSQQDSAEQEQEKSASQQSQQDSAEKKQEKSASQQLQQDSAEKKQEKSASQQLQSDASQQKDVDQQASEQNQTKNEATAEQQQAELAEQQQDSDNQYNQAELDYKDQLSKQQLKQWLQRIPDQPSILLQRKFRYQYQQQYQQQRTEEQAW